MKTDHLVDLAANIANRANKLIEEELRMRGIRGLAPSHGSILFELYQSEAVSMKELARRINRDKSTVTALAKKLEALGYIKKVGDPKDSRVTLVRLTAKGRKLRPDFEEISNKLVALVYDAFSEEEKEQLVSALERVLANLKARHS